jgi:hypothetical protein
MSPFYGSQSSLSPEKTSAKPTLLGSIFPLEIVSILEMGSPLAAEFCLIERPFFMKIEV